MKYLSEYRDGDLVNRYLGQLRGTVTRDWTLMEICGGQTHSLVKNGLLEMLPHEITMVHGPGCPVCVTPLGIIDEAIELAGKPGLILCSFGDMLRVPGSATSLLEAKANGSDIRIVYSPIEALRIAKENPDSEVVFFAVGFETTAPANALSVIQAERAGITNYSILTSHVLVPPAMEAILSDPQCRIDAFLAAGHVCTIMGMDEYEPIVTRFNVPVVVTGFEPVDLLQGILMAVMQLEKGEARLENQYARVVLPQGNAIARQAITKVFEVTDRAWRGIGTIEHSGYELKESYKKFNARIRFNLVTRHVPENGDCISGEIMRGLKKPGQCPNFGTRCKPEQPLGAPMVSSEGACAAYYEYAGNTETALA